MFVVPIVFVVKWLGYPPSMMLYPMELVGHSLLTGFKLPEEVTNVFQLLVQLFKLLNNDNTKSDRQRSNKICFNGNVAVNHVKFVQSQLPSPSRRRRTA